MFDNFKIANYSGSLLSPELYARHLSRLIQGDIIDGFTVTPGTGMQVLISPGTALVRYGAGGSASAREVSLVEEFALAIPTADASNPRIDIIVLYIDNAVELPSGEPGPGNLDGPGVAKAMVVQGTPAATPAQPNDTAIQAAIGAGNPYTPLYAVQVGAGIMSISAGSLASKRIMATIAASRIAGLMVGTANYTDRSITAVKVAANSLTANELAPSSVGTSELAPNSVTAEKIPNGGIPAPKIDLTTFRLPDESGWKVYRDTKTGGKIYRRRYSGTANVPANSGVGAVMPAYPSGVTINSTHYPSWSGTQSNREVVLSFNSDASTLHARTFISTSYPSFSYDVVIELNPIP